MNNGTDSNLQSEYEFNSLWAERVAKLIILGLIIDIVAVFILEKSFYEGALTIISNTLIVAGVWGEIIFEKRAKVAGDGIVAQANLRAAEATARAEEAKLELAKLTTPRFFTSEKETELTEKLKPFSGTTFDIGFSGKEEREQLYLVRGLEDALQKAGWTQVAWQWAIDGEIFSHELSIWFPSPMYGKVGVTNVVVEVAMYGGPISAADALVQALNGVGFATSMEYADNTTMSGAAIHILIGPRG